MSDHNEVSKLVFDCSFHATLPLFETGKPHHATVTPIYYMDTIMGLGFQPTEYVDVSEVIDTKAAMLEAHESQLTWLRDHDGVDIVEQMRAATRFRGLQCGVKYAEGFVPASPGCVGRRGGFCPERMMTKWRRRSSSTTRWPASSASATARRASACGGSRARS